MCWKVRAARALLQWNAADLSHASAVSLSTIRRAESADPKATMTTANALALRNALEKAGVEFIDENGGGVGVRLRNRSRSPHL